MIKNLTAVILAGGIGKRFWPLVSDKTIFPIMGKALIDYTVIRTLPKEINRIVIVTNSKNHKHLQNIKFSIPTVVVQQKNQCGMADALMSVKEHIKNTSLLIYIADHLIDKQLPQRIIDDANKTDVFGLIPGYKTEKYFPGGYLVLNGGNISEILEKPNPGSEPSKFINISPHYISDSDKLLTQLERTKSSHDDIYERALSELMKKYQFSMYLYQGISSAVKYPWNILDVMLDLFKDFKTGIAETVKIKENVIIEGPVFIADGAVIYENVKISGPSYIGKNTVIGNGSVVRKSHIGDNCVVGYNTEIARSYVGDGCWFHSNYVGDSVLEKNISMGSGAVIANLRLDEESIKSRLAERYFDTQETKLGACIGPDVRIGVNASIMPGVKIGSDTFISSSVLLDRDIGDCLYVSQKSEIILKPNIKTVIGKSRDKYKRQL